MPLGSNPRYADVVARLHEVMARAQILAESPAVALGDKTSSGKLDSKPPPGREPLYHELLTGLVEFVENAEREVASIAKGPNRQPETREQFRRRIIEQYEGWHPTAVREVENLSLSYVRRIRDEAGRDPNSGLVPGEEPGRSG